jgi:hypothetical protein
LPGSSASTKSKSHHKSDNSKGRKPDELLALLAVKGEAGDGKPTWSCIAPNCNHGPIKGNLQRERVLKHAVKCKHLQEYKSDAFKEAVLASKDGSLGAQLHTANDATSCRLEDKNFSPHTAASNGSTSTEIVSASSSLPSGGLVTSNGKLNRNILVASGAKVKEERRKRFNLEVNHALVQLICVCGLVPNILDSPQWENFVTTLGGGQYKRTGSDEFRNKFIPQEAVYVRDLQLNLLKLEENLTLTFDGTTIRKPASFYTAHATTPSRESYFLDGHEGSGEHHDTVWIMDKLLAVRYSIHIQIPIWDLRSLTCYISDN